MTPEERTARLADLRTKLAKREKLPGYETNVAAIKAEIERLEAEQNDG